MTLLFYLGEEIINDGVVEDRSDSVSGQAVAVGRSRGLSEPVAEEEPEKAKPRGQSKCYVTSCTQVTIARQMMSICLWMRDLCWTDSASLMQSSGDPLA